MPERPVPRSMAAHGGFTLVEVMVALLVGAVAVAGARAVSTALVEHADRLQEEHDVAALAINGERLWRQLVLDAEAGRDPRATFGGEASQASFDSWCLTAHGWTERCRVRLSLSDSGAVGDLTLSADLSTGERLVLGHFTAPARFAFLEDASHGGTWSGTWGPGFAAPVALGILLSDDTLVARTGRVP